MRAMMSETPGGPESLKLMEMPSKPLGKGQVNIKAFVQTLKKVGYRGPLCIEREVGNQEGRLADVAYGAKYLRECLA